MIFLIISVKIYLLVPDVYSMTILDYNGASNHATKSECTVAGISKQIFKSLEYIEIHTQGNLRFNSDLFLKCIYDNTKLSIVNYFIDSDVDKTIKTNNLIKKSIIKTKGYILNVQDLTVAESILQHWLRTKELNRGEDYVMVTAKAKSQDAKNFLHCTWKNMSYFNVLFLAISNDATDQLEPNQLTAYIYNPFLIQGENTSKCFQEFTINEANAISYFRIIERNMKRRVLNLEGYPLRITMHRFGGLSEPVIDNNGKIIKFIGPEGEIVSEYARVLNFTPLYQLPRDEMAYGGEDENGILSGSLLDMEEGYSDLSGNYRILLFNKFKNTKFLISTMQTAMVIIVPKAEKKIKRVGMVFSILNRASLVVSFVFIAAVILAWTFARASRIKTKSKTFAIIDSFTIVLFQCIEIINFGSPNVPTKKWERGAYLSLSIWAFLIGNVFIGRIVTKLAADSSNEIETFEDLANSNLMVGNMYSTEKIFLNGIEGMSTKDANIRRTLYYKKQFLFYDPASTGIKLAYNKSCAIICPDFISKAYISEYYSENGEDLIHEMKQIINRQYCAQMVPLHSPLAETLDKIQNTMELAGILKHWNNDFKHKLMLKKFQRPSVKVEFPPLNVKNLQTVFNVWTVMLALSTIVFLIELLVNEIK